MAIVEQITTKGGSITTADKVYYDTAKTKSMKAAIDEKADKTNVLEKNNTTTFTPTANYHPVTKKYVDDADAALEGEIAALASAGAKNLLKFTKINEVNAQGVTFTVNDDMSCTINGTASATSDAFIDDWRATLKKGRYILSGVSGGSNTTYLYRIGRGSGSTYFTTLADGELIINVTAEEEVYTVRPMVYKGATINNVTVYPMIRDASIKDDTYQPYTMSNLELTKGTVKNGSGVTPRFADTAFIGHESNGDMMTIRGLNSNTNGMALNFYATNKILRAYNRTEEGTWKEYGNISLEDTGWITITSDIQDIVYRKKNGILYLRTAGNVKQAFPNVTPTLATLPAGYRPSVNQFFLYATRLASGNYGYKVSNYGFIEASGAVRLHVENVTDIAVNDQIMINAAIAL